MRLEFCGMFLLRERRRVRKMRAVLESNQPPEHLWNAYGPTEGTVFSTALEVSPDEATSPRTRIGQAVGEIEILLLDEQLRPIWDMVLEPDVNGLVRLYRTGDLAEWRPHAGRSGKRSLDFTGCRDIQIKNQGFRVGAGRNRTGAGIKSPCQCGRRHQNVMSLVARVVLRKDSIASQSTRSLLQFARRNLPYYMAPNAVEVVPRFPLTPNGKVDRQALRERSLREQATIPNQPDAKSTRICLWQAVLWVYIVTEDDDFFRLGASSIQTAALIAAILERTGKLVSTEALFSHSRVSELVQFLESSEWLDSYGNVPDGSDAMIADIDPVDDLSLVPK
ncbi:hypothetical protein BJX99DRAFT_254272 [Aspergillus californicus]